MAESSYKIIQFKASELPESFKAMVHRNFLLSLRHGNRLFKLIDASAYYAAYPKYVSGLMHRPEAVVKIAVLSDDEDVALGWALIERRTVHYVFVPPLNRRIGIAKSLVGESFNRFSHITNLALIIWNSKFPKAKFDPFLLSGEENDTH